jgi:hypothetical protein
MGMPVPVISSTQSVLSVAQWQDFSFNAAATGNPTEWSISPIAPAGMGFSTATGVISGPPTIPGVFNFTLRAKNSDGWSDPMEFTLACYYSDGDHSKFQLNIDVDIDTRIVSGWPTDFSAKYGDDLVLRVSFKEGSSALNLDLNSLKFGLKERDGDPLILNSQSWRKVSTGITGTTFFLLYIPVTGPVLAGILGDYEQDTGTFFTGIAEIEWVERNARNTVGPDYVRLTSRTFPFRIARDLI